MAIDDSDRTTDGEEHRTGADLSTDLTAFTDLTTAFYRGEVDRTTVWRSRLDQTTNWAVVVVAAILTWAFSSTDNPHFVILIGIFGITAFLVMEANRYREYDIWRGRVRTLQEEVFAQMYDPEQSPDSDWQTEMSDDLRNPKFALSFREALTHRLRRSYLPLLLILLAAWTARITVFEATEPWHVTAGILGVSGEIVVIIVGGYYALLIAITAWSARGGRVQEFKE